MSRDHELLVLKRAEALSLDVHRSALRIRRGVAPSVKRQLLRAVESIASNIAEGSALDSRAQFAHHLGHALASARESRSQLRLARGLKLLPEQDIDRYLDEVDQISAMTYALRRRLHEE
jgi:four helix bundle protein